MGSRILILGFAYKANTSDFRNTKVIDVYNELKSFGLKVDIFDPIVNVQEVISTYKINLLQKVDFDRYKIAIILAAHYCFEELQKDRDNIYNLTFL